MNKPNNKIKTWYLYLPECSQKTNRYEKNSFHYDDTEWRLTDGIEYPVITYQNNQPKGDISNGK